MPNAVSSAARLAAYATAATGAMTATTNAEIKVYDGPPIPIDGCSSSVDLTLGLMDFDLKVCIFNARSNPNTTFETFCCSYTETKGGGTTCLSFQPRTVVTYSSFFSATLNSAGDVNGVAFVGFGDPVGLGGTQSYSFYFGLRSQITECGEFTSTFYCYNCDDERSAYIGFNVVKMGQSYKGWAKLEGSGDAGLAITQWAFEDTGADITAGELPPSPCSAADVNGDGKVDAGDLGMVIAEWGNCP